jgi:hypothetical protein
MPNSLPVPAGPSFSQSSAIAFSILIGFIVFITCRGQLGAYFAVFLGQGGAGDNPGASGSSGSGSPLSPSSLFGGSGGSSLLSGFTGADGSGGDTGWTDIPGLSTVAGAVNEGGLSAGSGDDAVINVSGNAGADNEADGLPALPSSIAPDGF